MISDLIKKIFGDKNAKDEKLYQPFIVDTNKALQIIQNLSDTELRGMTHSFQERIKNEKISYF